MNKVAFSSRFLACAVAPLTLGACAAYTAPAQSAASGSQPAPAAAQAARPNVIFILADDLGYGDTGPYGQLRTRTPNLDALAAGGMKFTQHYAGSSVCAPSRASLLTGLDTGHSQVRGNYELGGYLDSEERGQYPLREGTQTIATMLRDQGYRTAVIGKWGLGGPESTGHPNKQGFDYFFGLIDQKQSHNFYPTHLWRNDEKVPLNNTFSHPHPEMIGLKVTAADYHNYVQSDYAPERMTQEAKGFIRQNADKPFFLYLTYPQPHAALQVPDEDVAAYDGQWSETPSDQNDYSPHPKPRAARAGMISRLDRDVGQIVALLKQLGLDKNTLVIFSSDNGPSVEGGADLDFFNASGGLKGTKRDLYEGGVRVPMIAYWPGKIGAGAVSDHVSANWDVMPTLAALTGAKAPAGINGLSFLPTLLGKSGQMQHTSLYWEFADKFRGKAGAQAVRLGQWKAIKRGGVTDVNAPVEVYDLTSDRAETHDVAAQHPDIVARAAAIFAQRQKSTIPAWEFK